MAQASSVHREPSMEEILASIRKIIEDGDAGSKQAAGPGEASARDGSKVVDVGSFRSLRETSDFRKLVEADDLAEDEPASDWVQDEYVEPVIEPAAKSPEPAPAAQSAEAASNAMAQDDDDSLLQPESDWQLTNFANLLDEELKRSPITAAASENAGGRQAPIMSDSTHRQVAASFGELSDAFAASRQKSFDEMAAEMIRPMLQDWLDNNLPTLVERLVREEIERVARGPAS